MYIAFVVAAAVAILAYTQYVHQYSPDEKTKQLCGKISVAAIVIASVAVAVIYHFTKTTTYGERLLAMP